MSERIVLVARVTMVRTQVEVAWRTTCRVFTRAAEWPVVWSVAVALFSLVVVTSPTDADPIIATGTIEAFRQQSGNPPVAYATGYSRVGDGGEGILLRLPDSCVDDSILHYQNREGVCYIRGETNGIINVKWAGAHGDGVHDDSDALSAAHSLLNKIVDSGGTARLVYPAGTYLVRRSLALPPNGSGWELTGYGMPTIVGLTDNTPIFRLLTLAKGRSHKWKISGFRFQHKNDQGTTNRAAVAIALGSSAATGDGIYDFEIERVVFVNGWRGISVDPESYESGHTCPIWGWYIKDITSYTGMTGATIWLDTLRAGSPRGNLVNFYAQNKNSIEPAVSIKGMSEFYGTNLEFNQGENSNLYLQNRQSIIDSIRFEGVRLTTQNAALATFGDGQVTIRNLEVQYFVNDSQSTGTFLSAFRTSLILENLWTFGARGTPSPGWNVARVQRGATFDFRGSWRRFEDGEIKMN